MLFTFCQVINIVSAWFVCLVEKNHEVTEAAPESKGKCMSERFTNVIHTTECAGRNVDIFYTTHIFITLYTKASQLL